MTLDVQNTLPDWLVRSGRLKINLRVNNYSKQLEHDVKFFLLLIKTVFFLLIETQNKRIADVFTSQSYCCITISKTNASNLENIRSKIVISSNENRTCFLFY